MSERLRVARDGLVIYLGIRVWWDDKVSSTKRKWQVVRSSPKIPFSKKIGVRFMH